MWRSPISSRRASGHADYIGAFVVTAGIGEDEVADRFKHANDDYSSIMVKALADRLAEAFAERLHQRVRKEFWGYAADETLQQRRTDRREVSRHPPGARLSGAARPHREGDAVPAARRRADRREADRELRDVAGRFGLRALFQPPGEPLFRRRQDRARPGRGLRRAQGLDAWRRPSAGSRRSSTTIRWRWRADAARVSDSVGLHKTKHRRDAPPVFAFWPFDGGLVLGANPELQNAPSRTAPTNTNAAHTASTFSRKARSTFRPPQLNWTEV